MVDLHSHILWGIDDGSKDSGMTVSMLKEAVKSGTKVICATPHYLRDRFDVKYSELQGRYDELLSLCKEHDIDIKIVLGQEVYYCENIVEIYKNGEIGPYKGTNYMLVELPMREFDVDEVCETLYELQVLGINIIIAHPERYKPFLSNPELINSLIKEGLLFQLNAGSMGGAFGKEVMKLAERYFDNGIYSFVGSDAHRDTIRNTNMEEFLEIIRKRDENVIDLFDKNGYNLIENKEIKFEGSLIKKEKKGLFSFFKR